MRNVGIACALAAILGLVGQPAAMGQRVQFATPLSTQETAASAGSASTITPPPTTYAAPNTTSPYASSAAPSPYTPPALPSSPAPTAVAPTTVPGVAAPSVPATAPGAMPMTSPSATFGAQPAQPSPVFTPSPAYGATPAASLSGSIQSPPATWDPYATPTNTPSALLQQDPYFQSAGPAATGLTMGGMTKFLQRIYFDYDWLAGNGDKELGINDVVCGATFALPLFKNIETPFLITPGFGVHLWSGPIAYPPTPVDMPGQTYDAFLDAAWAPQINPWLGADLAFRVGVYSDFKDVTTESLRYTGRGLAVITVSPSIKIKAGIIYYDRVNVKLLPAGGIIWTPNADIYFNILFPNPKVAKRITTFGNTEWWIYGAGDYGGGTWTIKRNSGLDPAAPTDGFIEAVSYNDIRICAGLEFRTMRQMTGYFEVGLSCSRELVYDNPITPNYYPKNTVYLGAGISY